MLFIQWCGLERYIRRPETCQEFIAYFPRRVGPICRVEREEHPQLIFRHEHQHAMEQFGVARVAYDPPSIALHFVEPISNLVQSFGIAGMRLLHQPGGIDSKHFHSLVCSVLKLSDHESGHVTGRTGDNSRWPQVEPFEIPFAELSGGVLVAKGEMLDKISGDRLAGRRMTHSQGSQDVLLDVFGVGHP